MALPYVPGGPGGKPRPVEQVHFDVYPAGDLWLAAEEMARFLGAHLNGGTFQGKRILTEASVKLAHEPQFGGTYAFGWSVSKDSTGHTIISHGGGIPGMSSLMMGDLDARVGVYFMSNSGAPGIIAEAAIKLLRGEEYVPPAPKKPIAVDPKILDTYVGVYDLNGTAINVVRSGAGLVVRVEGQPEMALLAETTTRFFITTAPITIVFGTDAQGVVDRLEIISGGTTETAKRRK
jgi:CubicO group peptidase (beta-lactamase class C family)